MWNVYLRRLAGPAIGLLAAATLPALAADLDAPYPDPDALEREERIEAALPPPPHPAYGPRFSAGPGYAPAPPRETCRTTVTRRVDIDGDEVERRVSVCDAVPDHPPPFRLLRHPPNPLPPADIPYGRW